MIVMNETHSRLSCSSIFLSSSTPSSEESTRRASLSKTTLFACAPGVGIASDWDVLPAEGRPGDIVSLSLSLICVTRLPIWSVVYLICLMCVCVCVNVFRRSMWCFRRWLSPGFRDLDIKSVEMKIYILRTVYNLFDEKYKEFLLMNLYEYRLCTQDYWIILNIAQGQQTANNF